MNDYVLNHDFGYGREPEDEINKLTLRNITDLNDYLKDILENDFENVNGYKVEVKNKEFLEAIIGEV